MIRTRWFVTLFLMFAATAANARPETINYSEPPYYMPSYDEFNDWTDEARKKYLNEFLTKATEVPALSQLKAAQLEEASLLAESWQGVRSKLYEACSEKKSLKKLCKDLADLRVHSLEEQSSRGPAWDGPLEDEDDAP